MLETNRKTQFLIHVREKCMKFRKFEEQLTIRVDMTVSLDCVRGWEDCCSKTGRQVREGGGRLRRS
jgi:hypothetical protein